MAEMKIYHLPGACSRVTLTALEQIGQPYEDEVVNLMKGAQHTPEYRAVNPRGKIPALLVDGELLTENAAIIWWLGQQYPEAGLFPVAQDAWQKAQQLSDLFWISAGWHPSVRANRMPVRWTTGDPAPVKERGRQLLEGPMTQLDQRLKEADWWYGNTWSITDVYFYWNYTTAQEGDFPLDGLDGIAGHRARVEQLPAFQRALAREKSSGTFEAPQ